MFVECLWLDYANKSTKGVKKDYEILPFQP